MQNPYLWPAALRAIAASVVIVCATVAGLRAAEAETVFRGGPERASLLELYTSEGCSSCPPAEQWLGGLREDPRLWRKLVPVAFHVDYWDGLGWKDRLAQPAWTARQRAYAAAWGGGSVYTPGFVLDGREWRGWFEKKALPEKAERAGVLEARMKGASAAVRYAPEGKFAGGTAHAVFLGFGIVSDVRRGENSGRALRHDFAVLGHAAAKLAPASEGAWAAQLDLPQSEQKAGALAVWIEVNGSPVQAAGGWVSGRREKK